MRLTQSLTYPPNAQEANVLSVSFRQDKHSGKAHKDFGTDKSGIPRLISLGQWSRVLVLRRMHSFIRGTSSLCCSEEETPLEDLSFQRFVGKRRPQRLPSLPVNLVGGRYAE